MFLLYSDDTNLYRPLTNHARSVLPRHESCAPSSVLFSQPEVFYLVLYSAHNAAVLCCCAAALVRDRSGFDSRRCSRGSGRSYRCLCSFSWGGDNGRGSGSVMEWGRCKEASFSCRAWSAALTLTLAVHCCVVKKRARLLSRSPADGGSHWIISYWSIGGRSRETHVPRRIRST